MATCDLNEIALAVLGRLLDRESPQLPLAYGDPKLQELLHLTEYARVERFRFLDSAGAPSKRNLLAWLKSRAQGRTFSHEKLYGFAEFAAAMSWRGDVADLVNSLLDDPRTQESIHVSTLDKEGHLRRLRSMVSCNPYLLNQQGEVPVNKRYGIISWHHEITADLEGNGTHKISVHLCNLLSQDMSLLTPPIFVDRGCSEDELKPWANTKDRSHKVTARIEGWSGTTGAVFIRISPPLQFFETIKLSWGYRTPTLFVPGEEYYRFDINNPTTHRVAIIRFCRSWQVTNVRTLGGRNSSLPSENAVEWEHYFPAVGLYEVRFTLAR